MPRQVFLGFVVEFFMILLTTILLTQPRSLFRAIDGRNWVSSAAMASGLVMLALTFCWSVILGAVLAMHGYALRF